MSEETRPSGNNDNSPGYPAEKARQGRIILSTPARKIVFAIALAGAILIAVILSV